VNADLYSDVIVGAPLNDAAGGDAGRAYIFYGGASMNNVPDVILTGEFPGNQFGFRVASAGNFNGDNDCDGSDAATFKVDFGRNSVNRPCTAMAPCNGDFSCNGNVDGTDAARFKSDFGRNGLNNPCPISMTVPWCAY
jgi:hypothetical protein